MIRKCDLLGGFFSAKNDEANVIVAGKKKTFGEITDSHDAAQNASVFFFVLEREEIPIAAVFFSRSGRSRSLLFVSLFLLGGVGGARGGISRVVRRRRRGICRSGARRAGRNRSRDYRRRYRSNFFACEINWWFRKSVILRGFHGVFMGSLRN